MITIRDKDGRLRDENHARTSGSDHALLNGIGAGGAGAAAGLSVNMHYNY